MCLQKKTYVFIKKNEKKKPFMCLIGDACIINGSKRRQLAAFKLDKLRQCVGVACIINAANS
jgi:hypothetical protein